MYSKIPKELISIYFSYNFEYFLLVLLD